MQRSTYSTCAAAVAPTLAALTLLVTPLFIAPASAAGPSSTRSSWRSAPEGTLAVMQFALCRRVVDRRPDALVNGEPVEADGDRVYGFVQLFNKGSATTVTMVWRKDGRVVHHYQLRVGRSPSWHTWSYVRANRANRGSWNLSVLDASGTSLADRVLVIGQ